MAVREEQRGEAGRCQNKSRSDSGLQTPGNLTVLFVIEKPSSPHLVDGDPMAAPTLRTLARQLGLSRTTISEALSGSPRVKADTAARVRAAAADRVVWR